MPVVVAAFIETSSHRRLLRNVEVQFCREYAIDAGEDFSSRARGVFAKVLDKHPAKDAWNTRLETKLKKMTARQQQEQEGDGTSSEDEAPDDIAELDGLALEEVEKPEAFEMQNRQRKAREKKGQKRNLEEMMKQGFLKDNPAQPSEPPAPKPAEADVPEDQEGARR